MKHQEKGWLIIFGTLLWGLIFLLPVIMSGCSSAYDGNYYSSSSFVVNIEPYGPVAVLCHYDRYTGELIKGEVYDGGPNINVDQYCVGRQRRIR